jgi:hypothetical protein
MSCLKFSFLLIIAIATVNVPLSVAANKFTSQQCLDSKFNTEIKHEGSLFGLIKKKLTINKDKCLLEITYKNILPSVWKVDLCREPIHMKVTMRGTQDVYKRGEGCSQSAKSEYCGIWKELKEKMQDYGLIYAGGEREFLNQPHGQTYCSYLLLQKYLEDGILFSSYEKSPNIYDQDKTQAIQSNTQKSDIPNTNNQNTWNSNLKNSGASGPSKPVFEDNSSSVNSSEEESQTDELAVEGRF